MTAIVLSRIKSLLSLNKVSIAILFVAMAGRLLQVLFFFNIRSDRSYQLLATTNLLKGHGVTLAQVYPNDLSHVIYTPLINWPPAYSVIMAPLYALSAHNYIMAALGLDMMAAILLILVSRSILKLLLVDSAGMNLYTIVAGFFIYPFYFISSTDSLSVTIFAIAVYYTFLFLKTRGPKLVQIILFGCCLLLCGCLKYLFIPLAFIPPAYLLIKGVVEDHRVFKKIGILSLLILSAGLALLFIYQLNKSGSAAYVSSAHRGFFPQNLLDAYPFLLASFLNPASVTALLASYIHSHAVLAVFQVFNVLLFTLVLYMLARQWIKKRSPGTLSEDFYFFSALVSLALLFLLSVLSLRMAKTEELPGNWWTFLQEPRYYGVVMVLIHLSFFLFLNNSLTKLRKLWKYIFYLLCLFLFTETVHGIVFSAKRVFRAGREEYSWKTELHFQQYADSILRHLKPPLVVTSTSYYMANRVALYNNIPVLYTTNPGRFTHGLNTTNPVMLLDIISKEEVEKPGTHYNSKPLGYSNGFYFYAIYVQPH